MAKSVRAGKYTVIAVRYSNENQDSAAMNWWIEEQPLQYQQQRQNSIKVSGLPAYVSQKAVLRVFRKCGAIRWSSRVPVDSSEEEDNSHLPKSSFTLGGYCMYIQFKTRAGLTKTLDMEYDNKYAVSSEEHTPPSLTDEWCSEIRASYDCDLTKLKENCTEYMREYDSKYKQREKDNKKAAVVEDDEGWVTVTRTKTNRPPKALKAHELRKLRKHKQNQTLVHFYKNQVADTKMQKIRELKAKFEEDKKRIQEMKQQRKFKPY